MEPIKIQAVINLIENHLPEALPYEEIAARMAVSEADLQRSFKMITGLTISEYIRYRRLTCAALELQKGDRRVLDIALSYGYQTAESFTKAFKQYHGCTPMEAKSTNQPIRYFTPIVVKLAKRGGKILECSADYAEKADTVTAYYDSSDEHTRLTRSRHGQLEYLVTMQYLQEVLPAGSRILDCCAGTGIYAFALAKNHPVVAGDLSAKHVQKMRLLQAEQPQLQEIHQLNVCDLHIFEDESFDAVLCMGALYHLFDSSKQMQAIQECTRVCKKNGILVFSYLNKWGSFYNGFLNNLKPMELLYREFNSGNNEDVFVRTTPSKINRLCQEANLQCICNIGVDHLAYLSSERMDAMTDEEFQRLLSQQLLACKEPDIAGTSLHGLWIGRK